MAVSTESENNIMADVGQWWRGQGVGVSHSAGVFELEVN